MRRRCSGLAPRVGRGACGLRRTDECRLGPAVDHVDDESGHCRSAAQGPLGRERTDAGHLRDRCPSAPPTRRPRCPRGAATRRFSRGSTPGRTSSLRTVACPASGPPGEHQRPDRLVQPLAAARNGSSSTTTSFTRSTRAPSLQAQRSPGRLPPEARSATPLEPSGFVAKVFVNSELGRTRHLRQLRQHRRNLIRFTSRSRTVTRNGNRRPMTASRLRRAGTPVSGLRRGRRPASRVASEVAVNVVKTDTNISSWVCAVFTERLPRFPKCAAAKGSITVLRCPLAAEPANAGIGETHKPTKETHQHAEEAVGTPSRVADGRDNCGGVGAGNWLRRPRLRRPEPECQQRERGQLDPPRTTSSFRVVRTPLTS